MSLDIERDRGVVRVGETVTFTIYASNDDGRLACNIANATIYVQLPGADGQPVPEAQAITLSSGENFSSGASRRLIGTVRAVMNVNAGVFYAVVRAFTHGTLHDTILNDHDAAIQKTLGTVVIAPRLRSPRSGPPSAARHRRPSSTPTRSRTRRTRVRSPNGTPPCRMWRPPTTSARRSPHRRRRQRRREAQHRGDLDLHLHLGFNNAGVFTNTAKVCADNIPPAPDNIPKNYCSPPATWTVTVPPPPAGRSRGRGQAPGRRAGQVHALDPERPEGPQGRGDDDQADRPQRGRGQRRRGSRSPVARS